jgi:hypothetical protein
MDNVLGVSVIVLEDGASIPVRVEAESADPESA